MKKNNKIIYIVLTTVFFVIFNFYFSDVILNNGDLFSNNSVFDITFIQNQGAAFSLFNGYKVFLITFSFIALIALIYYIIKHIEKIPVISLFFASLLLSGIFNNMSERIFFGFVRDYFRLKFIDFPIFNISDIFINIGVFGLIFIILKNNYLKNN